MLEIKFQSETGQQNALSQEVINSTPFLIRKGAESFRTQEEKTIYVYSALTACGSLLTSGSGLYYQRRIYPNLFFILLAPAASGKSSLTSASDLLYPVHMEYLNKSLKAQEQYRQLLSEKTGRNEPMQRPPFQTVLIPGNITASKLVQQLADNDSDVPSCINESELDTISQANKSNFGGFSDVLRKAFHNEKVSAARKANDEFFEVKRPKLSMILSGTPKQLFRLVPSAEDGLYSRCMFYAYNPEIEWIDVSPDAEMPDVSSAMEKLSKEVYSFWRFFKGREVTFELSTNQWKRLNAFFGESLQEVASVDGTASVSVIKRAGVICFKLCMILTALRAYEFGVIDNVYECYDRDFTTALALTELSLNCSLTTLEKLPDGEALTTRRQKKESFKASLPESFSRTQVVELAKKTGVIVRTLDRWLDGWIKDGFLLREEHGYYRKRH